MGINAVVKRSASKQRSHHHKDHRATSNTGHHQNGSVSTSSSPHTARETFLNYFFGQNGPGPVSGSSMERSSHQGGAHHSVVDALHQQQPFHPVGRDISGAEPAVSSGLMAGKRQIDGNNAAYDMKSLGKHIEAVSSPV